jgi:hypothetical protein
LLCFTFAACDNIAPTPTPTRPISAPTLEPSPTVLPLMQEQLPTQLQFVGQNDPTAAALPRDSDLPPLPIGTLAPGETRQPIQITAPDGIQLNGDLYVSPTGPDSPGILMLSADNRAWLDLPLRLQQRGYTVLAMPLRSGLNASSDTALGDFGAMIEGLGQISDPGHLAVIGAESGADVGLAGCAVEPLCKALVLFTPTSLEIAQASITRYNPRPIFLAVVQSDAANFGIVEYIRGMARGEIGYDAPDGTTVYGAALLQAHPALADQLIEWLAAQLN